MPVVSKIFFALSILALIVTGIIVFIDWLKYRKQVKAYKIVLNKLEAEDARKSRLAKEAEVIKRFHEMKKEIEVDEEVKSS